MRGRLWRRLLGAAASAVLALGVAPLAGATPAAAWLRNPPNVGSPCPDAGGPNLKRLPGRDGQTRLPETNPPRSYEYDWPGQELVKMPAPGSGKPGAPTPAELDAIDLDPYAAALDYDPFTGEKDLAGRPRREVIARWNRANDQRDRDVANGRTYNNGKPFKPLTPADWPGWVSRAVKGQRNTPMGDAYEDLVRRTLGLSGKFGWKCNESMEKKGGDKSRYYDAVNHDLRLIYEFKSTCTVDKGQLDKDIQFMRHQQTLPEGERYTIVYIFAVRCNSQKKAMEEAGIQRYLIAAKGTPRPLAAGAVQAVVESSAAQKAAESAFTEPGQAAAAGAVIRSAAAVAATAHEAEAAAQLLASSLAPGDDVADWTADELGGVDFTTLELRYLADPTEGKAGLQYAFSVRPNADGSPSWGGLRALQESSDSFFVWLALDPSRLWVNLHPDEPTRIIDPELGRTDAGRALLEADLQMKKTVARVIHPDTKAGAKFWAALRGMDSGACLTFRQWIVPAPATVREDGGGLYIVDAPLAVKLASEHRPAENIDRSTANCRSNNAIDAHNEKVFRDMVLPQVEKAVNTAPEYAALRRVYLTRVAAEWYKQRSLTKATALRDVIGSNSTARWPARTPWTPRAVSTSS